MDKPGTLLEAGTALPDQAGLVHPDPPQRPADSGKRALTHPQNADIGRLHQRNFDAIASSSAQRLREVTGGDPTGRTTADDENASGQNLYPTVRL